MDRWMDGWFHLPRPLALGDMQSTTTRAILLYLITLFRCITTNLDPRQSLWWPMCLVLCFAAPLARGFETPVMLPRNPVQHLLCCPGRCYLSYLPFLPVPFLCQESTIRDSAHPLVGEPHMADWIDTGQNYTTLIPASKLHNYFTELKLCRD